MGGPVVGDLRPIRSETASSTGLTCIHDRIQCCATQDNDEVYSETDLIIVNDFLNTLAEIALAVAARNTRGQDDQD